MQLTVDGVPGGMYQPNYMDEQLESRVVTSVVTTQPQIKPMAFPVRIQAGEWDHALCDSCGDASACCIAMCCPCLIHKDIAAHIGQNESCCFFWSCIAYFFPPIACCIVCNQRKKVRRRQGIQGGCCNDCLVAFLCRCCALIQMKREIQK